MMNTHERLVFDIKTLMESVGRDWREIDRNLLNPELVDDLRKNILYCYEELKDLYARLDHI